MILIVRKLYQFFRKKMVEHRDKAFPPKSLCYYLGNTVSPVVVVVDNECPPDKVPVRFENGNIWWKNFEELKRVPFISYS